jgi:hypothetical protein
MRSLLYYTSKKPTRISAWYSPSDIQSISLIKHSSDACANRAFAGFLQRRSTMRPYASVFSHSSAIISPMQRYYQPYTERGSKLARIPRKRYGSILASADVRMALRLVVCKMNR